MAFYRRKNDEIQKHNMKKLAIVIPFYKIDFFEETLKSVAQQTNKDFSLYIGNDASKHDPLPIISKYFSEEDYHYFNYEDNLGGKNLALQWERILENVKEDWFQILGDDDMISANFVEEFHKNLPTVTANNITAIKCSHNIINEQQEVLHAISHKENLIAATELFKLKYYGLMPSSLSENIFLKSAYLKYKFLKIPFAWGADDFAILTFSGLKNVFYITSALVTVRVSQFSISGNNSNQNEKRYGYHLMRKQVLNNFSGYFEKRFLIKMLNDHFDYCANNLSNPNLHLIKILLLRGYPKRFFYMFKSTLKIKYNILTQKK